MKINRRSFLQRAALGAGALTLSPRSWAQVAGANSDVRVAVIGFHGRGREHIKEFNKINGARITALCDVDSDVLDSGVADFSVRGQPVERYADIRKLLESKNVDAISIATPNHWHALAAIWGLEAGKHVYVEKPVAHTVREGEKLVAAAGAHRKIVQAGTQSRSSSGIREAVEWVRQGHIGKIIVARALCYKPRPSIGRTTGPQPVPPSVDYDLWCGPSPLTPPRRAKFHYDWHWFWDYGDGDIGNQAIHEMDVARWFLGEETLSPRVVSVGARLGYVDDGETPNTLIAFHDYPKAPLIMEVRGLPEKAGATTMDRYQGVDIGVVIECEGGRVVVPDYRSARAFDKEGKPLANFEGVDSHFGNFIDAIRHGSELSLRAPIRGGHLSTALCHTANISWRIGYQQAPDTIRERLQGDRDGLATFQRMAAHLAANNIDLEKTPLVLGQALRMNPANERFIDNAPANVLLSRQYRQPFAVK